jgi:hypothetical protein
MLFLRIIAPIVVFVAAMMKEFLSETLKKSTKLKFCLFIIMLIALGVSIVTSITENKNNITQQMNLKSKNDSLMMSVTQLKVNNDSLITLVAQLKTNEDQKNVINDRVLQHQINSTAPVITLEEVKISDEKYLPDSTYAPKVSTIVTNVGKREAYNFSYRIWVIPHDFSSLQSGNNQPNYIKVVVPNQQYIADLYPKLKKKILPIYSCLEIKYYDKVTNKNEYFTFFNEYKKLRDEEGFYICDESTKIKIVDFINKYESDHIKL